MRVSVDTDAGGAAELVAAVARVNIRDALRSPAVRDALLLRVCHRRELLVYGDDARYSPFHTDEWASFVIAAERSGAIVKLANGLWGPGDPDVEIIDDCEGMTATYGAGFILAEVPWEVYAAITHPRGTTTAHAFNVLRVEQSLQVFDGSVLGGMKPPRQGWYGQTETAKVLIEPLSSGRYDA